MSRTFSVLFMAVIFVFFLSINSCTKNTAQPLKVTGNCDTVNLTYTNGMQAVVDINCGSLNTSCHSAGGHGDFSNYASMQHYITGGESSIFWRYIFTEQRMPIAPELPLDACARAQFRIWLLAGAPQ